MSTTLSPVTALAQLHLDTSWPSPCTARVAVVGEVDLASAHMLRDRLLGVLREQDPGRPRLDLAGVTFLDCTGSAPWSRSANAAAHNAARCGHPRRTHRPAGARCDRAARPAHRRSTSPHHRTGNRAD